MTYLRNPLTYVWVVLTAVTVFSWWISQDVGIEYHVNPTVTLSVLLIAAVKVHLVIRYFMEVRHAPTWLARITRGWLVLLMLLLCGLYLAYARG